MFKNYPAKREYDKSNLYQDVLSHTEESYNSADKVEVAHELTHGINNTIRNSVGNNVNAVYCLRDISNILEEPKVSLRQVAEIVPKSQRGTNYNLCLVTAATHWNHQPLYILDEWSGYTNGGEVGNYLLSQNDNSGEQAGWQWTCCLEFFPYVISLVMAIHRYDKAYVHNGLHEFIRWNWQRITEQVNKNDKLQSEYVERRQPIMENYLNASDNIELRNFAKLYLTQTELMPDFGTGSFF